MDQAAFCSWISWVRILKTSEGRLSINTNRVDIYAYIMFQNNLIIFS
jgi:hypothetical protein